MSKFFSKIKNTCFIVAYPSFLIGVGSVSYFNSGKYIKDHNYHTIWTKFSF